MSSELSDRERLELARDRIESALERAGSADLPALSREYRLILAALRELPDAKGSSLVDELKRRREARERRDSALAGDTDSASGMDS